MTGARPAFLPGERLIVERPFAPGISQLFETRYTGGWQAPEGLFPELPSAQDAQVLSNGTARFLYFAAIPPRGTIPRLHVATASGNAAWSEPQQIRLPEQGKGAVAPDVLRDRQGTWWLAYGAAGPLADIRLARSANGLDWDFRHLIGPGSRPKLATAPDGTLLLAYEHQGTVSVRRLDDVRHELLRLPQAQDPALMTGPSGLLLATVGPGGLQWQRSGDGRRWSAPQAVPASAKHAGPRWLPDGKLLAAPADGAGPSRIFSL